MRYFDYTGSRKDSKVYKKLFRNIYRKRMVRNVSKSTLFGGGHCLIHVSIDPYTCTCTDRRLIQVCTHDIRTNFKNNIQLREFPCFHLSLLSLSLSLSMSLSLSLSLNIISQSSGVCRCNEQSCILFNQKMQCAKIRTKSARQLCNLKKCLF